MLIIKGYDTRYSSKRNATFENNENLVLIVI